MQQHKSELALTIGSYIQGEGIAECLHLIQALIVTTRDTNGDPVVLNII